MPLKVILAELNTGERSATEILPAFSLQPRSLSYLVLQDLWSELKRPLLHPLCGFLR